MSGAPNPEGVARAHALILEQATTEKLIDSLRQRIATDQATLKAAEAQYHCSVRDLRSEMEKMDLTSSGNTGHEKRMQSFLVMLTKTTLKGLAA